MTPRISIMHIAALLGAGQSMPSFKVKDDSTNVPGARFAVYHSAPKRQTEKKLIESIETPDQRKKRYKLLNELRKR